MFRSDVSIDSLRHVDRGPVSLCGPPGPASPRHGLFPSLSFPSVWPRGSSRGRKWTVSPSAGTWRTSILSSRECSPPFRVGTRDLLCRVWILQLPVFIFPLRGGIAESYQSGVMWLHFYQTASPTGNGYCLQRKTTLHYTAEATLLSSPLTLFSLCWKLIRRR